MTILKNITGALLIDATASFLNGAGIGVGEDKNKVIPKTLREKVNGRYEEVPYVSAQSWRRWLRNTTNEENKWNPSELRQIKTSEKGSTNKISTELNPIDYPEDDIFGYMKSGDNNEESIQRTTTFKSSILKGLKNMRAINNDEAYVHLKDGSPLPYSTKFYSTHLEGFFNLEYYRLGVYDNLGSRQELTKEFVQKYEKVLDKNELEIGGKKFSRYKIKNLDTIQKKHASGLLKGLVFLRGGAKLSAFGSDVAPKVLIIAGMETANPVFNNLFIGTGEKPALNIEAIKQISNDYKAKLATPIFIGLRTGYLENEEDIFKSFNKNQTFELDSPIGIIQKFNTRYLKS